MIVLSDLYRGIGRALAEQRVDNKQAQYRGNEVKADFLHDL